VRIAQRREQIRRFGTVDADDRTILHPKNYLVLHPVKFYKSHKGDSKTRTELITWFAITWLLDRSIIKRRIQQYWSPTHDI